MQDLSTPTTATGIADTLRTIFGFHSFRPNQEEIIRAILARQDCFVVMPTGGGKSLCYQLPAHMLDGTCMVISPLISLMKDQVDAATATGLRAAFLNSSLTLTRKRQVEADLAAGELDLLYVSPERFAMPEFVATLKQVDLSFVAIDEAHCISEWGHDFRPDYLNLSTIIQEFPNVPVTAFTATATHKVQDDIVAKLGLRSPHVVRASFNRPNLFYKVVPKKKPGDQILRFVKDHAGEPGIIYRTTRKSVEQTAGMLERHGIRALPYHAGLDDATRVKNQDAFNKDEVDVIVATVAFGMGIDKSNVRYVLHGDLPKNIESYYQETGRSGRDGEPAHCLLLFGYGDLSKIRFFINEITDENEKKHAVRCLNDMVHYATVHACRRKQLLNYFGETFPNPVNPACHAVASGEGRVHPVKDSPSPVPPTSDLRSPTSGYPCCDICENQVESIDATQDAQIIMSAIARTGERFGITHIVSIVTGDATDRIHQLGHDQIKTFGVGSDRDERHWRLVIDNLLAQGLILQTVGDYPILQLAPTAREVLLGNGTVTMLKAAKAPTRIRSRKKSGKRAPAGGAAACDYDKTLFDQLRDLRKALASEQNIPPFVVFSDRTLHEMARSFPTTETEMMEISGVGEAKLSRYGAQFIEAVQAFSKANPYVAALAQQPETASRISDPVSRIGGEAPSHLEEARRTHPRAYEKWTDEEDERLRQAWDERDASGDTITARVKAIAADFGRQPSAIRSRLKKLGLVKHS